MKSRLKISASSSLATPSPPAEDKTWEEICLIFE